MLLSSVPSVITARKPARGQHDEPGARRSRNRGGSSGQEPLQVTPALRTFRRSRRRVAFRRRSNRAPRSIRSARPAGNKCPRSPSRRGPGSIPGRPCSSCRPSRTAEPSFPATGKMKVRLARVKRADGWPAQPERHTRWSTSPLVAEEQFENLASSLPSSNESSGQAGEPHIPAKQKPVQQSRSSEQGSSTPAQQVSVKPEHERPGQQPSPNEQSSPTGPQTGSGVLVGNGVGVGGGVSAGAEVALATGVGLGAGVEVGIAGAPGCVGPGSGVRVGVGVTVTGVAEGAPGIVGSGVGSSSMGVTFKVATCVAVSGGVPPSVQTKRTWRVPSIPCAGVQRKRPVAGFPVSA